ncbi:PREDICTED: NADH dehydrogenase [ubiquinone] 1 beta subcomplex subunit 10 [Tinamus guttatus]|nr:PREDICTED: NADH dehydrogenase [ubiquinone] 1 beta subcomplex subunit 10 [Tinamus guttatus]
MLRRLGRVSGCTECGSRCGYRKFPATSIFQVLKIASAPRLTGLGVLTTGLVVAEWIERQQSRNKFYYYHQQFRRVPDLSECVEGDHLCYFEAEAQWRRDRMVDQEIMGIVRERLSACQYREGPNHLQNCAKEMEQLLQVTKAYQDKYGDLGVHGNSRTCLMKQKHMMMEERKAQENADH